MRTRTRITAVILLAATAGELNHAFLWDLNNGGNIVCALISRDDDRRYGVLLEPIPERWRK